MNSLLEAVRSRLVIMDGAMGTQLQTLGLDLAQQNPADWNLTHPDEVRRVHREYVGAGAEVLISNTFMAMDNETRFAGVELARAEAPAAGWVLLDIGPMRGLPLSGVEARATLAELPPIDGILLETFSDVESLTVAEAFAECDIPVVLSLAYRKSGGTIRTFDGESPEFFAERAASAGVSVLGVNCGREMDAPAIIEVVHRYRAITPLPILARPNAGYPAISMNGWATQLPALMAAGATMIGGCCGTTPAFVEAIARL